MQTETWEALLPLCQTDRQREIVNAIIEAGSVRGGARKLGIAKSTVQDTIHKIKRHTASIPIPEGQRLAGTSTLIDRRTNTPVLEWVKTSVDQAEQDRIRDAVFKSLAEALPRYDPIHCEGGANEDLMNVYVITDYHFGMKSWREETGTDWDLEIAETLLVNWFASAIAHAPMAERAVFAQMGDFLHFDGLLPYTPESHHLLDVDTRFQKVVRVVIRSVRKVISMLLKKHQHVTLLFLDANHDPASGAWLREWLAAVYSDEPRITVNTSPNPYVCVEHGKTALFFTHGHKRGTKDMDRVFAGMFSEAFGRTKHRYAHCGHLHSDEASESALMKSERHRTLAAPDAYSARGGWLSGRDAKVITYHRQYGEVSRLVISPDMVMDSIGSNTCELVS